MLTGSVKERPSRRRSRKKQETPVRIVSANAAASVLTLTFDQPVVLKGVPAYVTDVAGPPAPTAVSAVASSPTVVAITFSAAIAAATEVTIPPNEPGIRGVVGGYVADTTFPV